MRTWDEYIAESKRQRPDKWQGEKRVCSKCGEAKELSEYRKYTRNNGRKKIESACLECHRKKDRKRVANLTEHQLEKRRKACRKYSQTTYGSAKKKELQELRAQQTRENGWSYKVFFVQCQSCGIIETKRAPSKSKLCSGCVQEKHKYDRKRHAKYNGICKDCGKESKPYSVYCKPCAKKRIDETKRKYRRLKGYKARAEHFGVSYNKNVTASKVFKRDNYKCQMCGCKVQKKDIYADNAAEVDHIIPMSKGGGHEWHNVQTSCRKCNINKGNKLIGQLKIEI